MPFPGSACQTSASCSETTFLHILAFGAKPAPTLLETLQWPGTRSSHTPRFLKAGKAPPRQAIAPERYGGASEWKLFKTCMQTGEYGVTHLGSRKCRRCAARNIGGAQPLGERAVNRRLNAVGNFSEVERMAQGHGEGADHRNRIGNAFSSNI